MYNHKHFDEKQYRKYSVSVGESSSSQIIVDVSKGINVIVKNVCFIVPHENRPSYSFIEQIV